MVRESQDSPKGDEINGFLVGEILTVLIKVLD